MSLHERSPFLHWTGCSEQVTASGSPSARIAMTGWHPKPYTSEPFGRRPWNGSFGRITYRRWRPNLSRGISLAGKPEKLLTFLAVMASSTEVLAGLVDRVTFRKRRPFFLDQPEAGLR